MSPAGFRPALVNYIREQAKPVDKLSHQSRLYALTREIGAGHEYDDDVVFAAVWLHDLGVFVGHRPETPAELARWVVEQQPGGSVTAQDDGLMIDDAGGCTVWLKSRLTAPVVIRYEARVLATSRV